MKPTMWAMIKEGYFSLYDLQTNLSYFDYLDAVEARTFLNDYERAENEDSKPIGK